MIRSVLFSSLVVACQPDPKGGVDIIESSTGPEIAILNCSDQKGPAPALVHLEVRPLKDTVAGELACFVNANAATAVVSHWTYGTPLDGYSMKGCGPLQPGTYEVGLSLARNRGARAVFSVDANGQAHRVSGGCR